MNRGKWLLLISEIEEKIAYSTKSLSEIQDVLLENQIQLKKSQEMLDRLRRMRRARHSK